MSVPKVRTRGLIPAAQHLNLYRPSLSANNLYHLLFDSAVEDQWLSDDPVDAVGQRVDPLLFREGKPLDVAAPLVIPIYQAGRPLDVSLGNYELVVTERIGPLIGELAPHDVQRIPARVESMEERYEVLNILARIDCVDPERTVAQVLVEGDPPHVENGTLASLAPLLDPKKSLYDYVRPGHMRLKTAGLEGPRIFRAVGWEQSPIVTEDIKRALEAEGATGLAYRSVS